MSRSSIGCLLACIAIPLALFLLFAGSYFFQSVKHTTVRERTQFAVPNSKFEIAHSRIGIHPMMAEYDRDVTFIENGTNGNTKSLSIDTCGGYPINCYQFSTEDNTYIRMDDAVSEHLLDLNNQTVNLITRAHGNLYYGELTDSSSSSGWSMTDGDPDSLSVTIGGNPAKPLSDIMKDNSETYIGRITGNLGNLTFVPASESAEVEIDYLWER